MNVGTQDLPPPTVNSAPLNGASPPVTGVPISPKRDRNTLWIVAGIVLVVLSGIAAATVARSLTNRVDVLVATRTIAEGEVITEELSLIHI